MIVQIVETSTRQLAASTRLLARSLTRHARPFGSSEGIKFLFLEGIMPGTIHQCQGRRPPPWAVCTALRPDDFITSTFRGHGHALAKGMIPGIAIVAGGIPVAAGIALAFKMQETDRVFDAFVAPCNTN